MKIVRDLITLALAISVATVIIILLPVPTTSYYGSMPNTLSQGPLVEESDKSLLAVGLLSKKSVMDSPSKEIKPAKPPPTVPEHAPLPVPDLPKITQEAKSDIKASITASTEMTGVPPSAPPPSPPPSLPSPAGPSPGPQPSNTDSTTMSGISSKPPVPPPPTNSK